MTKTTSGADRRLQLGEQRRKVDYDTYDVAVDELLRRVEKGRINIAPVYQRQFRWDAPRQSRLIESVLLGIPIPPLFMATNTMAGERREWEVVDGLQRLLSLVHFAGTHDGRTAVGISATDELVLEELDKLNTFEGARFADFPGDLADALLDQPMRVVVLNDKSDLRVRYDLFERLNTGGISLTAQEIRECVFRGEFMNSLGEWSSSNDFRVVVRLSKSKLKDGTPSDYALRFFAFHQNYREFNHSVKDFLKDFTREAVKDPRLQYREVLFRTTFAYLRKCFPDGIKTRKGETPVNLFEGISVGAALALEIDSDLDVPESMEWVSSPELRRMSTGATNSKPRVVGRVEYCRDRFLGHA